MSYRTVNKSLGQFSIYEFFELVREHAEAASQYPEAYEALQEEGRSLTASISTEFENFSSKYHAITSIITPLAAMGAQRFKAHEVLMGTLNGYESRHRTLWNRYDSEMRKVVPTVEVLRSVDRDIKLLNNDLNNFYAYAQQAVSDPSIIDRIAPPEPTLFAEATGLVKWLIIGGAVVIALPVIKKIVSTNRGKAPISED